MQTSFGTIAITAMLSIGLLLPTSPAAAEDSGQKVTFEDLDLSQSADVAALYERIQAAARSVCQDDSAPWDARRARNYNKCFEGTVDQAVRDINNVSLTALHQEFGEKIASR